MLSAGSAYAWAQWIIDTSTTAPEKNFDDAPQWFDSSNWTNGYIAANAGNVAYFWTHGGNWESGIRYVKLDRDLTVAQIVRWWNNSKVQSYVDANKRVVLGGDHTITLDGGSGRVYLAALNIYGNIDIVASSSNPLFRQVDICGPLSNSSGRLITFDAMKGLDAISRFRRDLWADGTSEGITNFAPAKVHFDGQMQIGFYAPEGSDGVSGTWALEEGSAIVRRIGDAHALSAGTVVTGEGVPAGAYVKRIYSDSIFELSAAATASSGEEGTTLDFAAFRPKAYQRIDAYSTESHSSTYYDGFWPMKHSAKDEMTVEFFDLKSSSGTYHFYVDCEDGYLPGRLVLHNTSTFKRNLYLGTCEVEFAATTNSTAAGFPNVVRMRSAGSGGADDVARVIVPEGVEARFGSLANVIGTIIKDGAGSLTAPVLSNEVFAAGSTGTLVVESGSLALECAEGDPIQVDTLAITNGATFTITSCGFEAKKVFAETGAIVKGTGFFYFTETNDISGIAFDEGIKLVRLPIAGNTVYSDEFFRATNVVALVVGNPAVWFDASKSDSFVCADDTAYPYSLGHKITRWYDVRGEEYGYADSDSATVPQCWQTNVPGRVCTVRINSTSTTVVGNRNLLKWKNAVSGIRSVFKVISTHGGGGPIFGGTNRTRLLPSGNTRVKAYNKPIFGSVPESYTNGLAFYLNGDRRDWRRGYAFGGPTSSGSSQQTQFLNVSPDVLVPVLAEVHFPDDTTYASNFGYTYAGSDGKGDNGMDAICECIIYTNELSEVERLSVRKYLMDKWCSASLNYKPTALANAGTRDIDTDAAYRIDDGETLVISDLSGDGALTKYGDGTLAVERSASNALHVVGGVVSIRSEAIPFASELPGDPYLHLDANSGVTVEDGRVSSWVDVRGDGHPVAMALNAGKGPTLEEDALNDMPAVDFGPHFYGTISANGSKSTAMTYGAVSNVHTVIQVLDSSQGGGALLGWHVQSQASIADLSYGKVTYGLYRNNSSNGGDWTKPLVSTGSYTTAWCDLRSTDQPGGARVRLNGVDVDGGATGFSGGYDIVSVVTYKPTRAGAIAQLGVDSKNFTYGGQKICELLIYTNVLSRAEVKAVEAYLNKKWFNRVSEGYEPAAAKSIEVDAGAKLEVWGGAPVAVESLSVAGTLDGAADVADGGEIAAVVASDGAIAALDITGGLNLLGGGTLVLSGNVGKTAAGRHPLAAVNSGTAAGWVITTSEPTTRRFQLTVEGGQLVLTVVPPGSVLVVR